MTYFPIFFRVTALALERLLWRPNTPFVLRIYTGHCHMKSPFNCKLMLVNTLRPRQNGRHFADNIFKCIFLNENVWISLKISLKFVPEVRINNIPALVQIMAWRRSGDKALSGTMMVSLLTHICVTRPQWVKIMMCACLGVVGLL